MLSEWDYLNAMNVADANNYIPFENLESREGICDPELFSLCCQRENAEKQILKRDRFQDLSEEAKQIIMIIISSPSEIIQILTPKTQRFSLRLISNFISKNFFERTVPERKTRRIVNEIKEFVKEL